MVTRQQREVAPARTSCGPSAGTRNSRLRGWARPRLLVAVLISLAWADGACWLSAEEQRELVVAGSGSAFVVNPDGYLLTCAHVVAEADQVHVSLGEQTVPATVAAVDKTHDLALLKVNQALASALPLAAPTAGELGEEVRAFGFPLQQNLGTSVKVTRGTISGKETIQNISVLQIDVAINRGNSGGPLVNNHGEVVGIVNGKLRPTLGSDVAFAVPAKYAREMLGIQGVPLGAFSSASALDGPELARRISPSVALVLVSKRKGEPSGASTGATGVVRAVAASSPPNPPQWVKELPPQAADDYLHRRSECLQTGDPKSLLNWLGLWHSALSEPNRTRLELDYIELLLTQTAVRAKWPAREAALREAARRLETIARQGPVDAESQRTLSRLRALLEARSRGNE